MLQSAILDLSETPRAIHVEGRWGFLHCFDFPLFFSRPRREIPSIFSTARTPTHWQVVVVGIAASIGGFHFPGAVLCHVCWLIRLTLDWLAPASIKLRSCCCCSVIENCDCCLWVVDFLMFCQYVMHKLRRMHSKALIWVLSFCKIRSQTVLKTFQYQTKYCFAQTF